jgi:hypothetical protein
MDVITVEQAVTTLRHQGKPVSVRNVRQLTGGSFRDISRILQALRSALPADQPPQGQAEPVPAVLPRPAVPVQASAEGVTSPAVVLQHIAPSPALLDHPAATSPPAEALAPPPVADPRAQALAAYQQAWAEYEEAHQLDGTRVAGLSPIMRTAFVALKWRQVEVAYEKCLAAGIAPARR